jgi:hypothetical protein
MAVCPILCVGKKDKKEIKTFGSPPGALDILVGRERIKTFVISHSSYWKTGLQYSQ